MGYADQYSDQPGDYGMPDTSNGPGPSGIPDPYHPGYDTAGYPLPTEGTGPTPREQPPANTPPPTRDDPTTPPTPPNLGAGALAPFSEPAPTFTTQPGYTATSFKAPTFEEALNNPGFQFRMKMGEQALQNAASARGTLNDSGTLQSMIDYGQNAGAAGYGDVFSRDFSTWQANEDAQRQAYGLNRQTQYIDPWTAAYNAWVQRGNFYLNNQNTVANTALGFAQL